MFHDIQDLSTLHLGHCSGGVPAFWHHLVSSSPGRSEAFTFQLSTKQPVFGIGLLRPNSNGTAEPDLPFELWPPWPPGQIGSTWPKKRPQPAAMPYIAVQQEFCSRPARIFKKICAFTDMWPEQNKCAF